MGATMGAKAEMLLNLLLEEPGFMAQTTTIMVNNLMNTIKVKIMTIKTTNIWALVVQLH